MQREFLIIIIYWGRFSMLFLFLRLVFLSSRFIFILVLFFLFVLLPLFFILFFIIVSWKAIWNRRINYCFRVIMITSLFSFFRWIIVNALICQIISLWWFILQCYPTLALVFYSQILKIFQDVMTSLRYCILVARKFRLIHLNCQVIPYH